MDCQRALVLAQECGFEIMRPLDVDTLQFRNDVREMCNPAQCPSSYNNSWSCPPAVPSIAVQRRIASAYEQGIIVQTVGKMSDEFDYESIQETNRKHTKQFAQLALRLAEETEDHSLPLGSGPCSYCETCTYPDEPCPFPKRMISSMEASGLLVSQVCEDNDLLYNHGKETIAFTSCCLF